MRLHQFSNSCHVLVFVLGTMKSYLRLGSEIYSDLMLAASVGNLCHLELDLQPFTGVDPLGRVQFKINLPMNLPAFYEWGVTSLLIRIPTDARGNRDHLCESASVVDIAPLQYGDEPFSTSFYARNHPGLRVHPILRESLFARFWYPDDMASFHSWIVAFCLQGADTRCGECAP